MFLDDLWDFIKLVTVCLLIIAAVVALVIYIAIPVDRAQCRARWQNSGMDTDYGFLKGCLVKTADDRWVPEDVYRELR